MRLTYTGTDSSGAIAYARGLMQGKREGKERWGQAWTDDDFDDIEHVLTQAAELRRKEQRKEWGFKDGE